MTAGHRRAQRWAAGAALAALALSPAGCAEEPLFAEIVLTVDTTFGVPCAVDRLRFEVTGDGEPVTRVVQIAPTDLPGSFTLVPAGEPGPVSVRVTAFLEDVEVAEAVHDTEFVADVSREVRFLLDESCVGEPCDAVAGGLFEELPEPAVRKGCGADAYLVRETFAVIQNACEIASEGRAVILEEADGEEVRSPFDPGMPFPFRFYGRAVSQFWIGDNGYVGLGDDPPMALVEDIGDPRSLGEEGFSAPGVLPFWDKLKTGAAGVCLAVDGVAPYRTLWITWSDACFLEQEMQPCGPLAFGRLRFSVGLEESSNAIYVGYLDMGADGGANEDRAHGQSATIGITDDRPKGCDASECSEAGLCENGEPCGYTEYSARETLPALPALEFVPQ
jgi:hypothetical protein